jgi:CelD/BcsL family acetyltransferase involved in cellulose biosynthesis
VPQGGRGARPGLSGGAVHVRVLSSEPELAAIAAEWRELAAATGARIGAGPLWCRAWLAHARRGRPLVVAAFRHGALAALAPLEERGLAGLRVTRFIGHGLGCVSELLAAPGDEQAAEACWATVLRRRCYLQLLEYRSGAAGLVALRRAAPASSVRERDACPVVNLGHAGLDSLLAGRPKALRRTLRRGDERLAEERCRHEVEVVRDGGRLARVLHEVGEVYDAAERHAPRQHLLAPPWSPFTTALLAGAASEGRLRLFLGRVGGRPVSFDVGLVHGGRMELWLGRYHPAYARFSPGHLSMRAVVGHALAEGLAEIDMGLGDDQYKRRWAGDRYLTLDVAAASSAPVGRLATGIFTLGRWRRGLHRPGSRPPHPAPGVPAATAGPDRAPARP